MSYEITLSADLKFIETWEIPYLLTQARYPYIPRAGVSAAEVLGKSETSDSAIVEFSDSDLALLDRVWLGRENWRTGIPLHAFADYLAAFNDSPERPVWNLRWIASGGKHLADRVEFDAAVKRDIANGTLPVRRKSTLEVILPEDRMQDAHRTSVVSFEDFRGYAKRFFVDVLTDSLDPVSESAQERRERLAARAAVLKTNHVKGWQKQLAQEEGVSQSRIKQLLSIGDETKDTAAVPTGGQVYRMGKR